MSNVKRLINASKSEINKMGPLELKESIYRKVELSWDNI